jgi:release factor glutamine methyltransferase
MTTYEFYRQSLEKIKTIYEPREAEAVINLLFESLIGLNRSDLIKNKEMEADAASVAMMDCEIDRLLKYEPVQYVTGNAWFAGLLFRVNPHVLIPRPETEELVKLITDREGNLPKKILDIGTGSGCIAVSIKKKKPFWEVTAIDKSNEALELAKQNAVVHHCDVNFIQMDFLDEFLWNDSKQFDCIVSNPPYIPLSDKESLSPQVRDYEPGLALFADELDPLLFYRKIGLFAVDHLNENGSIYLEIHDPYAADVCSIYNSMSFETELIKDMFGKNRIVVASRRR